MPRTQRPCPRPDFDRRPSISPLETLMAPWKDPGWRLTQRLRESTTPRSAATTMRLTPRTASSAMSITSSGCRRRVVVGVDEDAVDDVHAEEEDGQRPPRIVAADREQRPDRAQARADDPDDATVRVADHQREAPAELDDPKDDQDPAHGVQVGEY